MGQDWGIAMAAICAAKMSVKHQFSGNFSGKTSISNKPKVDHDHE